MRGLRSAPDAATAPIAGFHLFPFGGLRKSGEWLRAYGHDPLQYLERAAMSGTGAQKP
jgi:methylenetetrahydrofolate reductase (NADPH)